MSNHFTNHNGNVVFMNDMCDITQFSGVVPVFDDILVKQVFDIFT